MGAAGLVRMHCHQKTKDHVARRTAEGKTKERDPALPHAVRRLLGVSITDQGPWLRGIWNAQRNA